MTGIIILEGPDACGKTTLQQHIVKNYSAVSMHLTWNKELAPCMYWYQMAKMYEAIHLSKLNLVIVDRHWISEQIYAKVFRGGSPWPYMGEEMDKIWKSVGALYIMCVPFSSMFKTTLQRHKDNIDSSHPYTDDKYLELLQEYHDFTYAGSKAFATRSDVLSYNIEGPGRDIEYYCDNVLLPRLIK